MAKVVVGLSGGVDSSVAAFLLLQAGHDVSGMMLKLWSEPGKEDGNRCCAPDAMLQARRTASKLAIPFYAVDVKARFYDLIVQDFISVYDRGWTPNPCIRCNRYIRWGEMFAQAQAGGADFLATGHYAQICSGSDGLPRLMRGADAAKDQSYVLSDIPYEKLSRTLFPIGGLEKSNVREIAQAAGLPAFSRPESQDLCFLGSDSYAQFMERNSHLKNDPGEIVTTSGEVVGRHHGLRNFTIGQRKGVRVALGVPVYVIRKDGLRNQLVVGYKSDLEILRIHVDQINWMLPEPPESIEGLTVKNTVSFAGYPGKNYDR